jgi:hypothetical protein
MWFGAVPTIYSSITSHHMIYGAPAQSYAM